MLKTLTICDLCESRQDQAEDVLELNTGWGNRIHVCPACLGKPISLLVARMTGLDKQAQAEMEKADAPSGITRAGSSMGYPVARSPVATILRLR